jgi:uncharacterized protein YjgD (DUF1641 family)
MKALDLADAKPITGIWGMMSALKRKEVQEGLGVLIELSTVAAALKQPAPQSPQVCTSEAA